MNLFSRPRVPASDSVAVTLCRMDIPSLRVTEASWVKLYGETSPQVARIRALIAQREML